MSSLLAATEKNFNDMNLTELQEIAIRQQQQIEINQQLLLAKEKRLKYLKIEEKKNVNYHQQQQQQQQHHQQQQPHLPLNSMANAENISNGTNAYKLENLKQNVLGQELKIFKLKQLRNQILEHKLSNSNIYSELDLIKSLFGQKENDLYEAINKVNELSKQIEQLRKIKSISSSSAVVGNGPNSHQVNTTAQQQAINANELEKLRQELQIRNKLNDQQAKKIKQQHDLFNQKQLEVMELDRRINELQTRISKKRNANQQIKHNNKQLNKPSNGPTPPYLAEDKENGEYSAQMQEMVDQNSQNVKKFGNLPAEQMNEYQQQQQQQAFNEQQLAQQQQNQQQSSSPSKINAKFATKQEIANTYMNKFGSETYQRYHIATLRAIQQQQQQQQNQHQKPNTCMSPSPSSNFQQMMGGPNVQNENGLDMSNLQGHYSSLGGGVAGNNQLPSSSSSSLSMSPISMMKNQLNQQQQMQHQADHHSNQYTHQSSDQSNALPAHLRLEFDKLKYLPDMVKTIKKRHSISEVEGSLHTVPPQVFQKLFDKHHKNNHSLNEGQHQQQNQQQMNYQSMPVQQHYQQPHQPSYSTKLNQIKETNESKVNDVDVVNLNHHQLHHQQQQQQQQHKMQNNGAMKNLNNIQLIDSDEIEEVEEQEVEQKLELNDQHNENDHIYESDSDKLMTEKRSNETVSTINNNSTATATIYATDSVQIGVEQKEQHTYDEQNGKVERDIVQMALMNMSKVTKPIIKQSSLINMDQYNGYQYQQTQMLNTFASVKTNSSSGENSRRVNFDPHALLLDAAVEGELELVIKCANQVKDISEPNDEGITALHNSVCAGHFNIVEFLVKFGCDINYADNDGWTPLHCAASCNNLPMVKFLIENGASIYATTASDNETAIKKCEEDEDGFEQCFEYLEMAQKNLGDTAYNNALVYALYTYEAQNEDELSFKCFDKLIVLNKYEDDEDENRQQTIDGEKIDLNDGWWLAKHVGTNQQGLVPRNYLGLFPRNQPAKNTQESTIC